MASQTFLNLDTNKRNKLIKAAMDEFSNVKYTEVSINKIISKAEISRGSFYTYFIDKDDLFSYLLEINKNNFFSLTKNVFKSCNGDMRESFLKLFKEIVSLVEMNSFERFLKNIFIYFNIYREKFQTPGHELYLYVLEDISSNSLNGNDLEFYFHLFMHNLFIGIVEAMKSKDVLLVSKEYQKKVDILCYGIYKEDM